MEGNGQFVIRAPNNKSPMQLRMYQMNDNSVEMQASLADGTTQSICIFQNGTIILCDIRVETAEKLGIELANGAGHIKVCTTADKYY